MTAQEAPTTVRPAWVDEIVKEYGEPIVDCSEPIVFGDRTRQMWTWAIDRTRPRTVLLDDMGHYHRARVIGFGRYAELQTPGRPTDDEMRALVALAWPEAATG